MKHLQIYIVQDCWSCEEAVRLAGEIQREIASVKVELIDMERGTKPEYVFAAPTYVLDGGVIFLGNPTREQLQQRLLQHEVERKEGE